MNTKRGITMELKDEINDIKSDMQEISYIAFEACQSRNEAREKRHFFVEIVLILLLVLTNAGWLYYESSMETVTETSESYVVEQDGSDANNSIINGGEIVNGTAEN